MPSAVPGVRNADALVHSSCILQLRVKLSAFLRPLMMDARKLVNPSRCHALAVFRFRDRFK